MTLLQRLAIRSAAPSHSAARSSGSLHLPRNVSRSVNGNKKTVIPARTLKAKKGPKRVKKSATQLDKDMEDYRMQADVFQLGSNVA